MPSAVSPRATAVRTPGSSSTTSTRAIEGNLPPPGPPAPGSELSQHVYVRLWPWQDAGRFASPRPSAIAGAVGLGLVAVAGGAYAQPQLPPVAARGPRELGAHQGRPGPVQRHGRADQQPRAPRAAAGTPGRERHEHRPDLVRGQPPRPGGTADRLRRAHPGLRRHDPLGLELRRPHGRQAPRGQPSRTAPPRPIPRPPRRRRSPICAPRARSPSTAPPRWPVATPTSWCSPPPRPSGPCCARCGWPSTRRSGSRCA